MMLCRQLFVALLAITVLCTDFARAKSDSEQSNPAQFVDGKTLARTAEVLAEARYNRQHRPLALSGFKEAVSNDHGNVGVIEDDGTILTPINVLDLANRSILFTPAGSNQYSVVTQAETFDDGRGSEALLTLSDDDTVEIQLPFPFVFYGTAYNSVFVNSDGNLTFGVSDFGSTARSLSRMENGPPRISPLFDDLNPGNSGRVSVEKFSDRVLLTWTAVGEWLSGTRSTGQNTFQAVLKADGSIQFNYRRLDAQDAVVGIGPGKSANATISLTDLSRLSAATTFPGLIAEVFASRQDMDLTQIAKTFYRNHPDLYDGLIVFSDFYVNLYGAYAYAVPIRNAVSGIISNGPQEYDYGAEFGSGRRLSVLVNMGDVSRYPTDPQVPFLLTNNSLSILGQEFGHRWLAYVDIGSPPLLGREEEHWSFLQNTLGSVMEGNEIEDLGPSRTSGIRNFRTVGATTRYSPLDQYIMGLRPASEVPPWFVVTNPGFSGILPSNFPCRDASLLDSCPPFVGIQLLGTRRDVTINDVISHLGPRSPSFEDAQKDFRVAFILITQHGTAPRESSLQFLESFRTQWQSFFGRAVDGRGTMNTNLLYFPPEITSVSPARGSVLGGSVIIISGNGFQPDAVVTIGEHEAATTFIDANTLRVILPDRPEGARVVNVVIRNPRDGQSATLASGFTYVLPATTEVRTDIPSNGSRHMETSGTDSSAQVGYARLDGAAGISVVRFTSGDEIRSEAAIPAATMGTSFRVYAERTNASSTGIAILNVGTTPASITAQLNNGLQTTIQVAPGTQKTQFIQEIFPTVGSAFAGTISLASNIPIGIVALRGTVNQRNDFIMTTVPMSSGSRTSETLVFPQIADGGGYATELLLLNSTNTTITGAIEFSFTADTDRGTNSKFTYEIPGGGVWKVRTSGMRSEAQVAFAAVVPASGNASPAGTAVLKHSTRNNLDFEAGVPGVGQTSRAVMFGISDGTHRTVLSLVNRGSSPASVRLTAYRPDGTPAAAARTISLNANEHRPRFINELIPDLPLNFEGTIQLDSTIPIYVITLRTVTNSSGTFLMTAMPVIDLNQSSSMETSYFPQLVSGGNYSMEYLLLNTGSTAARLQFFDLSGVPLGLPIR